MKGRHWHWGRHRGRCLDRRSCGEGKFGADRAEDCDEAGLRMRRPLGRDPEGRVRPIDGG